MEFITGVYRSVTYDVLRCADILLLFDSPVVCLTECSVQFYALDVEIIQGDSVKLLYFHCTDSAAVVITDNDQSVPEGADVNFTCTASGNPLPRCMHVICCCFSSFSPYHISQMGNAGCGHTFCHMSVSLVVGRK